MGGARGSGTPGDDESLEAARHEGELRLWTRRACRIPRQHEPQARVAHPIRRVGTGFPTRPGSPVLRLDDAAGA